MASERGSRFFRAIVVVGTSLTAFGCGGRVGDEAPPATSDAAPSGDGDALAIASDATEDVVVIPVLDGTSDDATTSEVSAADGSDAEVDTCPSRCSCMPCIK
jgi:hypothetical protein